MVITQIFATEDIAEIFARIARGLHIAAALEAKLLTYAGPPERALPAIRSPRPWPPTAGTAAPGAQPADGSAEPAAQGEDGAESRLARMPSAEQIAKLLRDRPIGAVIAQICLDLGIGPGHALWRDLFIVLLDNGGNPHAIYTTILKRSRAHLDQWLATSGITRQTPLWLPKPEGWSPGVAAAGGSGPS